METVINLGSLETGAENQGEVLLSRKQLCRRWDCSFMTLHRREAAGLLHPLRFNSRMLRYKLSEIVAMEKMAEASTATEPGRGQAESPPGGPQDGSPQHTYDAGNLPAEPSTEA